MILKRIQVEATDDGLITNSYIICDQKTKETIIVDPGGEPDKIIEMLNILDAKVKYIFLTHCHADHTGGINKIIESKGGKILISRADSEGLFNPEISLASYINVKVPDIEEDSRLDDGDLIHIGNLEFEVIATPGHTKGGLSLYCSKERLVFTGDTLFSGTWGRTDLPTGSFEEIINSITYKLMELPDETIVYPGHGRTTMISDEKNIYLELKPKEF